MPDACPFDKEPCPHNRQCQLAAGDGEKEEIIFQCPRNPYLPPVPE